MVKKTANKHSNLQRIFEIFFGLIIKTDTRLDQDKNNPNSNDKDYCNQFHLPLDKKSLIYIMSN